MNWPHPEDNIGGWSLRQHVFAIQLKSSSQFITV